jgi:endonuclease/exonuclease/phosphatase family metal-dependent hydrolase
MVRSLFISVLAALILIAPTPGRAQQLGRVLRILTYNIHHGEGTDGKVDLERIAKIIQAGKPDLVALQEVDQGTKRSGGVDQVARLAELTGMHGTFGKAMDFQGGAYGVAMLSRWPLQEPRVHPLPSPAGVEPRVLLEAGVNMRGDAQAMRFFVTHVDHKSDPTHRAEQVAKIRELLSPASSPTVPAVLAGDLNATPKSEVVKSLLADWTDSAAEESFLTCPSHAPRVKIDYVLYRPATAWRAAETRAIAEAIASDHLPVIAVLELKQAPP